jgi:hypothetical protein
MAQYPIRLDVVTDNAASIRLVGVYANGHTYTLGDSKTIRGAKGQLTSWAKRSGLVKADDGLSASRPAEAPEARKAADRDHTPSTITEAVRSFLLSPHTKRTYGACELYVITDGFGDKAFLLRGPKGDQTLLVDQTDAKRLNAHWQGFLRNHGHDWTPADIETGETGEDWEPTPSTRYYAQRKPDGAFGFGPTIDAAIEALKDREARADKTVADILAHKDLSVALAEPDPAPLYPVDPEAFSVSTVAARARKDLETPTPLVTGSSYLSLPSITLALTDDLVAHLVRHSIAPLGAEEVRAVLQAGGKIATGARTYSLVKGA